MALPQSHFDAAVPSWSVTTAVIGAQLLRNSVAAQLQASVGYVCSQGKACLWAGCGTGITPSDRSW